MTTKSDRDAIIGLVGNVMVALAGLGLACLLLFAGVGVWAVGNYFDAPACPTITKSDRQAVD